MIWGTIKNCITQDPVQKMKELGVKLHKEIKAIKAGQSIGACRHAQMQESQYLKQE
ncbi:hypothetical protein PINS_up019868 [Pythium insidiosum]|nr:hypothetical protein PINS_up019868 [Pythium insidiosum]